jgi:hypothetical protein
MALQLVRACHDGATDEMLRQIESTYTEWHNSNHVSRLGIYWNSEIRMVKWLPLSTTGGPGSIYHR